MSFIEVFSKKDLQLLKRTGITIDGNFLILSDPDKKAAKPIHIELSQLDRIELDQTIQRH